MKKLSKTLLLAALALILGSGSAYAKGRTKVNGEKKHEAGYGRRMEITEKKSVPTKVQFMGQVFSVDEKSGTVIITDADGKETTIIVNPFTKVCINDLREEKKLSDIKKNDWVLYSLFNTKTENKIAAHIFVKNK